MLDHTAPPDHAKQSGSYPFLEDIVRDNGLTGFKAVLAAHVAAWHNTANNIAGYTVKKAQDVYSGPVPGHITDGIAQVIQECGLLKKSYNDEYLPQGGDNEFIASKQATCVAGMNVHSLKKLEVSQIFSLFEILDPADRDAARRVLTEQSFLVGQAMKTLTKVEDELEKEARARAVPSILLQNISMNAAYHKTVARDWLILSQAAQSVAVPGPGSYPAAPAPF